MAVDVFGKNSIKSAGMGSLLVGGSGHPIFINKIDILCGKTSDESGVAADPYYFEIIILLYY